MRNTRFRCFVKTIDYEFDYLRRKLPISQIYPLIITLACLVVTSFGDTISFFVGDSSPLPHNWYWLKNKTYVFIISIIIIIIPSIVLWISDFKSKSKENKELTEIVEEAVIPKVEEELNELESQIKNKFNTSDNIRLSVFVPVRESFLRWRIQMVCKTENIPAKELTALFKLDEGVLGYTFLKTRKLSTELINLSDTTKIPSTYVRLSPDNCSLINRKIKAVLVVSAFQNSSVAGLLAIDTDNLSNLNIMEGDELHSDALDWIIARKKAVKWIWRMKNNV